jgi:hypothetical protein
MDYRAIEQVCRMIPVADRDPKLTWNQLARIIVPFEVSLADIQRYINSQPDHRAVDMTQSGYFCEVGDVMVHFGKDQGWFFNFAGIKYWQLFTDDNKPAVIAKISEDNHVFELFHKMRLVAINNYGEMKRCLFRFPQ